MIKSVEIPMMRAIVVVMHDNWTVETCILSDGSRYSLIEGLFL